jgi:hypothetical protein
MLANLSLAVMASLAVQAEAIKQPPTAPPQLDAALCQAEALAGSLALNPERRA